MRNGSIRVVGVTSANYPVSTEGSQGEVFDRLPVVLIEIPIGELRPCSFCRAMDFPFGNVTHGNPRSFVVRTTSAASGRSGNPHGWIPMLFLVLTQSVNGVNKSTALDGFRRLVRWRERDQGYADNHENSHTNQFSSRKHVAP